MRDSRYVSVVAAVAGLFLMSAGAILAGEVAGPPGSEDPKETGAPTHANSACAFSGLNDYDEEEGQNDSHVQTAADSFKYYDLPHGFPGQACRGNSEPNDE